MQCGNKGHTLRFCIINVKNAGVKSKGNRDVLGHGQIYPQFNFVLDDKGGETQWDKKTRADREFN